MANSSKLVLSFLNSSGRSKNFNFNYIDTEVETASVKAVMQGMIANGAIYDDVPVTMDKAKIVVTNETLIDLDA